MGRVQECVCAFKCVLISLSVLSFALQLYSVTLAHIPKPLSDIYSSTALTPGVGQDVQTLLDLQPRPAYFGQAFQRCPGPPERVLLPMQILTNCTSRCPPVKITQLACGPTALSAEAKSLPQYQLTCNTYHRVTLIFRIKRVDRVPIFFQIQFSFSPIQAKGLVNIRFSFTNN